MLSVWFRLCSWCCWCGFFPPLLLLYLLLVGVSVLVGVFVGVSVLVGVIVGVGVSLLVGVCVGVCVLVGSVIQRGANRAKSRSAYGEGVSLAVNGSKLH